MYHNYVLDVNNCIAFRREPEAVGLEKVPFTPTVRVMSLILTITRNNTTLISFKKLNISVKLI